MSAGTLGGLVGVLCALLLHAGPPVLAAVREASGVLVGEPRGVVQHVSKSLQWRCEALLGPGRLTGGSDERRGVGNDRVLPGQ